MEDRSRVPTPLASQNKSRGLFVGVEEGICRAVGIDRLDQISSARHVLRQLTNSVLLTDAAVKAFDLVRENWRQFARPSRSRENWRWRVPKLDMTTRSPEVRLEREAVRSFEAVGDFSWANQVPIASGITGPNDNRRRAIDLVRKVDEAYFEFIELKVGSNNPIYAAIEILEYGFVWLLSRINKAEFGYRTELIEARRIKLVVLAPQKFYVDGNWADLEPPINAALSRIELADPEVRMTFEFQRFPTAFKWPGPTTDTDLVRAFTQRSRLAEE